MRTVDYHTKRERRQIVKAANLQGESTIHDDFLADGLKRLTLGIRTDEVDPLIAERRYLLAKLEADTMTFAELKTLLRIEHGLKLQQSTIDRMRARVTNFITR